MGTGVEFWCSYLFFSLKLHMWFWKCGPPKIATGLWLILVLCGPEGLVQVCDRVLLRCDHHGPVAAIYLHCYPFSSQLVLNLTLALSWVSMGHLLKLCNKGNIRVLHLTVLELSFGGRNRKRFEQAWTYNLLHNNSVLYHCAMPSYISIIELRFTSGP
jgi:hypothetical protein